MISKIYKKNNKKGFTLTEIIIVVAIIVILAGAGLTGVLVSIHDYNAYKQNLEENGGYQFEADARTAIENLIKGGGTYKPRTIKLNDPPTEPASATPTPGGGGGGDTPEPTTAPPDPTSAPPPPTSAPPQPTTAPQTPDPALPSDNGGGGGGGVSGGCASAPRTVSGTDGQQGVVNITGSGSTSNITISNGWNNTCSFTVKKSGSNYSVSNWDNDKAWVLGNIGINVWSGQSSIPLTSDNINRLKNDYGLTLN